MADTGVWDLDELNAVDMQLASTPKAKKLSQRKKRGSLMSRIENQMPSNVETDENAAYKNRSSSVVIDSDDEEMLRSLNIFLLDLIGCIAFLCMQIDRAYNMGDNVAYSQCYDNILLVACSNLNLLAII